MRHGKKSVVRVAQRVAPLVPVQGLPSFFLVALVVIMAAMRSRCGRYIYVCFLSFFFLFSFFPRLISAVADWMSSIVPHMVWP